MRTIHEVQQQDDIPTVVLIGSFVLVAAGFALLISFPLFQPFVAALGRMLLVLIAFSDEFGTICVIGFLIGLPFRALYLFATETGEPAEL